MKLFVIRSPANKKSCLEDYLSFNYTFRSSGKSPLKFPFNLRSNSMLVDLQELLTGSFCCCSCSLKIRIQDAVASERDKIEIEK